MSDNDQRRRSNRSSAAQTRARTGASAERRPSQATRRQGTAPARQTRAQSRTADEEARRRAPRTRASRPQGAPKQKGLSVPVVVALVGSAIVLSVLVTVLAMRPGTEAAREEAKAAQSQVNTLTKELDRLREQQDATDAMSSAASRSTAPAGSVSGVEDPWVETGRFTTGDAVLDEEVKSFVDGNDGGSKDRASAAFEMYKALAWADYVEREDAQHPSGASWRNTYAHQYFENGNSGNCYEFAAALMYCLRYLGYEDAIAEGILIELQSGTWGDHGIVFVTDDDGNACMCDTARGTDGWMIGVDTYNYTIESFENA